MPDQIGTSGDDILFGDNTNEIIQGREGNDIILGFGGDDTLEGEEGDDQLRGGDGDDTLNGGEGDDFIRGEGGDDIIDGGNGFDRASYFQTIAGVTVDLAIAGPQYTGAATGTDTLISIEHLSGSALSDTLLGNSGDNFLWGSSLNNADASDYIDGRDGDDVIEFGPGVNHTLIGGAGNDTLSAGNLQGGMGVQVVLGFQGSLQDAGPATFTATGFENLDGSQYNDTLLGDAGDNRLTGHLGDDTLRGGDGNDSLYGDARYTMDTSLTGGSGPIRLFTPDFDGIVYGNDTLEGGLGDDFLDGGGGFDFASYQNATGAVTVFLAGGFASGADGNDTLVNIEGISGSAFDDILFGDDNANFIEGGDGNDNIEGFDGADELYGDAGSDFVRGGAGNDSVYGGTGNDYVRGDAGDDTVDGGDGFDRTGYIQSSIGVTVDLALQGVAQDTVGAGMDTLISIEHVSGTFYGDTLYGDSGDNWIWGSNNTDPAASDYLDGRGGNDVIDFGAGTGHTLIGGAGNDTLSAGSVNGGMGATISLALQGMLQDVGFATITASEFENLDGSQYNDTLIGDAGDNRLTGHLGDDTLIGGDGNDALYGDARFTVNTEGLGRSGAIELHTADGVGTIYGNDVLEGGLGDDFLDGGEGIDTASYANASGGVTVFLQGQFASGADGNDTLINIENVIGSAFDDIIFGDDNDNVLDGGDGADVIEGRDGSDIVIGGNGSDFVRGGAGNDSVFGDAGNDYVRGDLGDDYVDGGDGTDRVGYFTVLSGVTVDLALQGVAQDTGGGGIDTLVNVENLSGTQFADTLYGDENANWIWGSFNDLGLGDTIDGRGGDDLIEFGPGAGHVLIGGDGVDTLTARNVQSAVTISLALQGVEQDTGVATITATEFENASGTQFDDVLIGDAGDNILTGWIGSDVLVGGAGNDQLYGDMLIHIDNDSRGYSGVIGMYDYGVDAETQDLDDLLEGGLGDDLVDGGEGFDTASYANASGSVTVDLVAGTSLGADGNDTLVDIEAILGSAFADVLTGDTGNNAIDGGAGNDVIDGGEGDDTLTGGDGDDTFFFGALSGADTITDFTDGDRITFDDVLGITNLNDLTIVQDGDDAVISWGTDASITLEGVDATTLGRQDFGFEVPGNGPPGAVPGWTPGSGNPFGGGNGNGNGGGNGGGNGNGGGGNLRFAPEDAVITSDGFA